MDNYSCSHAMYAGITIIPALALIYGVTLSAITEAILHHKWMVLLICNDKLEGCSIIHYCNSVSTVGRDCCVSYSTIQHHHAMQGWVDVYSASIAVAHKGERSHPIVHSIMCFNRVKTT